MSMKYKHKQWGEYDFQDGLDWASDESRDGWVLISVSCAAVKNYEPTYTFVLGLRENPKRPRTPSRTA